MKPTALLRYLSCAFLLLHCATMLSAQSAAPPQMTVSVDDRQAARRIQFVHEEITVHAGRMALAYPLWIPGEHGPTGPLHDFAALRITANGVPLMWARDPEQISTFWVDVPKGVSTLNVDFDILNENVISDKQNLLAWHTLVLYPRNTDKTKLMVGASVVLPPEWTAATSLDETSHAGGTIGFAPVTLERLIDSPVLAGRYIRTVKLASKWPAELDISGDSLAELDHANDAHAFELFAHLVDEDQAMFGFRHWKTFHILVSQSASLPFDGLEHEDSPYNGLDAFGLSKKPVLELMGPWLLAHEQSHAWDGKYRRPAELYSKPNYQGPERTTLLWVYEGLNQYLGALLAARAGFCDAAYARRYFALSAAELAAEPARRYVPLVDTATENWILRGQNANWMSLRRAQDFYFEGALVWLEADALIRNESRGKVTLDAFVRRFFGVQDTGPVVATYTRADVEAALQATWPHDWHGFFEERIYRPFPAPPTAGLEAAGWRLAYRDTEDAKPWYADALPGLPVWSGWSSIGLLLLHDGTVTDVAAESPADRAGMAPKMTIQAVNGNAFSTDAMTDALRSPVGGKVSLVVKNFNSVLTVDIPYTGGVRNPVLERNPNVHDTLTDILAPRRQ